MEPTSRYLLTFLLNSAWQIPLITAVTLLICRLMRRSPASHRHAIWVTALITCAWLPISGVRPIQPRSLWRPPEPEVASAVKVSSPVVAARPISANSSAQKSRFVPVGYTTGNLLVGIYLVYLLFRSAKFVMAGRKTIQIRKSASIYSITDFFHSVWERCQAKFELSEVRLLFSETTLSPVMMGLRQKTIILPASLISETSEDVLTTAIGHEMAHAARHDFLWNVLHEILYLPISFHPAAWILRRRIEQTREIACDELVTERLLDPHVYARSIVSIARSMVAAPGPNYALGVFDGDILEERIRRLVEPPLTKLRNARLALAGGLSTVILCAVLASGLAFNARAQAPGQTEMQLAAAAYNQGDFKAAVQHFQNALRFDPSNINTKLFLANALMSEYYREAPPINPSLANAAEEQYQSVLTQDPRNTLALHGAIAVCMDLQKFNECHEWAMKLVEADPKDKTAYFMVGAIDWNLTFRAIRSESQTLGVQIPDPNVRKSLRDQIQPQIEEGFRMLQIAVQLDPDYSDPMAYINLLYRNRASILDDPAAVTDSIAKGDEWVKKTLAAKRRESFVLSSNGSPANAPSAHLDVDDPPPGPAAIQRLALAPPPPPPPPPPGSMAAVKP